MTETIMTACSSSARKALMLSCASAALAAAALAPQAARAQAFQGSISNFTGSVVRSTPTSTTETLTIGTSTATINWSPTNQQAGGPPIDFLPSGNTATFTSTPGLADYTVLNRILPDSGQAIALNGHVISTLQGTNATGGHVWFYAPGGIVVGATAVFDVGSLLLTANDVTSFGTTATGFNASFSAPSGSTSSIQIQNGAQINALQQNSYVAMVAPRIEQGGTVRVNGSAAYAAGEQLSLTMNQGLFDIQVDVGTTDSNGIVHTGETSGPANATAADNHKIYMVAVPKNQAMTMLLGGTVGFDDAVSANVKNGAILLSSGADVADSDNSGSVNVTSPGLTAGIKIGPGNYTSDLTAFAQTAIDAVADTGDVSFAGNVLFASDGAGPFEASLIATNEHTLSVGGNATLETGGAGSIEPGSATVVASSGGLVSIAGNAALFTTGSGTSGGNSSLLADGGTITIGGLANLSASGAGGAQISSGSGAADGHGGSVSVTALDSGSITTGSMNLNALGSGQANTGTGAAGGGFGGSVDMDADAGSAITVNGSLTANASGVGGNAGSSQGGAGQGGSINLDLDGGSLTVSGTSLLLASGIGGAGGSQGGGGDGGSVTFDVFGGSAGFSGTTTINVASTGGNASSGVGGSAGLQDESFADIETDEGGSLTGANLAINANALGGNGFTAGAARGGEVTLTATDSGSDVPTAVSLGQVSLSANGTSGVGAPSDTDNSSGGVIDVFASSATLSATSLSAQANGTNGGGLVDLFADNAGSGQPGSLQFGSTTATANGGDFGGEVLVGTFGGTIDLGSAALQANGGFGGNLVLLAGCAGCDVGGGAASEAALPAGGGIAASDLTLTTSGNIFVDLGGGADVSVSGTLSGTAGQTISLLDDGSGGAIRAHEIDLTAITISDNADIVADIINFTTPSIMTLGNLNATDSITLTAGDNLSTGNLTGGNAITLNSGGSVNTQDLSAQTVSVTASADSSVGNVTAPGSATFTAGGLASFNGDVSSPTITVTSSDINIADGASLGVSGVTNLLTLNAVSHGLPIIIGDDGTSDGGSSGGGGGIGGVGGGASGQYELNEQGDIHATSVVINAQGAVDGFNPDVDVFAAKIEGGNTSNVTLNTGGSVFVKGNVDFVDATSTDSLTINAGHAIEVNTDTGGIEITDSSGALTGVLNLKADNIWVASGSVFSQLEGDVNFAGRDAALGTNSGSANQDGFVRAGTVNASVADSLLVQNSGTPSLFAGIDTGAGGLSITSTGTTPATLIVFGRQTTGTGAVITNEDFLGTVDLTGTGGFTDDSSVNGCAIGSSCGQAPITPGIDMASILGPLDETNSPSDEDKKKKDKQGDQGDDSSNTDPSLRLINTTPINNAPPITEPVTSGGDVVIGGGSN